MGYDQWLEQPYQDACKAQDAWDRAEEDFRDSDRYNEHYEEWLHHFCDCNIKCTKAEWELTSDYELSVECYIDSNSYC